MNIFCGGNKYSFISSVVFANAGAGKTRSIIERCIYLICCGVPMCRILCITHTRSASQEIKDRLRNTIEDLVKRKSTNFISVSYIDFIYSVQKTRNILSKSLEIFDSPAQGIKIHTIHSVLLEFMNNRSYTKYTIKDSNANSEIIFSNFLKYIEKSFCIDAKYFCFSVLEDITIKDLCNILDYMFAHKEDFLQNYYRIKEFVNNPIENSTSMQKYIKNFPWKIVKYIHSNVEQSDSLHMAWENRNKDPHASYFFLSQYFLTRSRILRKRFFSKAVYKDHPIIHDFFIGEESTAQSFFSFYCTNQEKKSKKRIYRIFQLGLLWIKWKNDALKTGDISLDEILSITEEKISTIEDDFLLSFISQIDHIILDEAQDTSNKQWSIICSILNVLFDNEDASECSSFYIVGDRKQAIYSFHGSSVRYFDEVIKFLQEMCQKKRVPFVILYLNISYRSNELILSFLNKYVDTLSYDSCFNDTRHIVASGNMQCDLKSFVHLCPIESTSLREYCNGIIQYVQFLQKEYTIASKDFLILFQRRGILYETFIHQMSLYTPFLADTVLLHREKIIVDYMYLCQFLLRRDGYALACFLKSPLGLFSGDHVTHILQHTQDDLDFVENALKSDNINSDVRFFLLYLFKNCSHISAREFFLFFLGYARGDLNIYCCIKKFYSIHSILYLRAFMDEVYRSCEYVCSLESMLSFYKKNKKIKNEQILYEKKFGRVMTVHQAKGLESSYIILADCSLNPLKKNFILQDKDILEKARCIKFFNDAINSDESEYYRLLYVALSRAKSGISIIGSYNKQSHKTWFNLLSSVIFQKCQHQKIRTFYNVIV